MKILATADLHIDYKNSDQLRILKKQVIKEQPDVVLIAGDVYDCRDLNPYKDLGRISKDIPIVFCLGNHEFAYRSVQDTLDYYSSVARASNVYCLDVCDYVDINGVRIVGNVLWFDGSLSSRSDVDSYLNKIDETWLDDTIKNFEPLKEHRKCVDQIKRSLYGYNGKSILLTHTVPHHALNRFCTISPNSVYNIYSGVYDLFKTESIDVNIAICGHTHKPATYYYDNRIECTNIGNDYMLRNTTLVYDVLEI